MYHLSVRIKQQPAGLRYEANAEVLKTAIDATAYECIIMGVTALSFTHASVTYCSGRHGNSLEILQASLYKLSIKRERVLSEYSTEWP